MASKTRKKKAAIALARKIAVVAWSMLKHKTDWDPERAGIVAEETTEEGPPRDTKQGRCDRGNQPGRKLDRTGCREQHDVVKTNATSGFLKHEL